MSSSQAGWVFCYVIFVFVYVAICVTGGIIAIRRCNISVGICALVFMFVFPPAGLVLGILGLCLPNTCGERYLL